MKRKYTRKQILESINYWKKQLRHSNRYRSMISEAIDRSFEYLTMPEKNAIADFAEGLQILLNKHTAPYDFNLRQLDETNSCTFTPPFTIDDFAMIAADFMYSGDTIEKKAFQRVLRSAFTKMDDHADLLLDEETGDVQFF